MVGAAGVEDTALVLAGSQAEAALEVTMQVALVGEAGLGGDLGDRAAGLEQSACGSDPVGELQRVRGKAGAVADEPDQTELADARRRSQLIQADVAPAVVAKVVQGET